MGILQELNYGARMVGKNYKSINQQDIYDEWKGFINSRQLCEEARIDPSILGESDFIQHAHSLETDI